MFAAETGDDVPEEAAEGAAENKAGGVGVPLVLSPEKLAVSAASLPAHGLTRVQRTLLWDTLDKPY
eukprot:872971-Pleurochrysis_carterae.AAC.1